MYKLINVHGEDASEFLQGQLTQDVARLPETGRLLAAWCNARGRVIVVPVLVALPDAIGMLVPATLADALVQRLTLYRFRARVEFDTTEPLQGLVQPHEADLESLIDAGRALIDETNTEQFTPHMLNLDKLDAISFNKGCYTGQEIVARTENLGSSKRRLMRYRADEAGITVGAKLAHEQRHVGEVVNVAGRQLLAVTPVERHSQPLQAGSAVVTPTGLPYPL